jgi:hypothetical protein
MESSKKCPVCEAACEKEWDHCPKCGVHITPELINHIEKRINKARQDGVDLIYRLLIDNDFFNTVDIMSRLPQKKQMLFSKVLDKMKENGISAEQAWAEVSKGL